MIFGLKKISIKTNAYLSHRCPLTDVQKGLEVKKDRS
jgi:hypothetical protein